LKASGRNLVDSELLAMAGMLQEAAHVEEVDLHDNSLLTDRSLEPFLQQLAQESAGASLRRLDIGRCVRAGLGALDATARLLTSLEGLQCLNLSHVPMATRYQLALCEAVGGHPNISTVNFADTGLGGTYFAKQCIKSILVSKSLRTLDLSWNCFTTDVFNCLGENLVANNTLRSLCVANCSATIEGGDTPVAIFIESLAFDTCLTHLDISLNRIDFRTALVIEDSLGSNKMISDLNLTSNPLGALGMRSILRLLSRSWTGLRDGRLLQRRPERGPGR